LYFLQASNLGRIDLLKIDVERAELDILRGIKDDDWPKVRQLVMEIHDMNDSLNEVLQLLEDKGCFTSCVVEQDDKLQGTSLFNLYATSGQHQLNGRAH
jgi:hypothetical protein